MFKLRSNMKSQYKKIIIGVLVIIMCIMLGYTTVSNYMIKYTTISEVLEIETVNGDVHVIGTIEPGSFTHLYNDSYTFILTDDTASMNVIYTGSLPSSFSENSEIVIIGTMESDTFISTKLIARCPSKFTE